MPRPRKRRCIRSTPPATFYKPQGIPMGQLRGVTLAVEGFEALRLVDAEGLSQEEAAQNMEVSRPTLCRILGEARTVVARALTNGWAIRIEDMHGAGTEDNQDVQTTDSVRTGCRGRGRSCGGGKGHGGSGRDGGLGDSAHGGLAGACGKRKSAVGGSNRSGGSGSAKPENPVGQEES